MPAIAIRQVSLVLPDTTQSRASALIRMAELRRPKQLGNKIAQNSDIQPINLMSFGLSKISPNFFQLLATFHPIGYG